MPAIITRGSFSARGFGFAGVSKRTIIEVFTSTANWSPPTGVTSVNYLVVAGGGGTIGANYSGGGGAG